MNMRTAITGVAVALMALGGVAAADSHHGHGGQPAREAGGGNHDMMQKMMRMHSRMMDDGTSMPMMGGGMMNGGMGGGTTKRPDAVGLAVPDMPYGSPRNGPESAREAYAVFLIRPDGSTEVLDACRKRDRGACEDRDVGLAIGVHAEHEGKQHWTSCAAHSWSPGAESGSLVLATPLAELAVTEVLPAAAA